MVARRFGELAPRRSNTQKGPNKNNSVTHGAAGAGSMGKQNERSRSDARARRLGLQVQGLAFSNCQSC